MRTHRRGTCTGCRQKRSLTGHGRIFRHPLVNGQPCPGGALAPAEHYPAEAPEVTAAACARLGDGTTMGDWATSDDVIAVLAAAEPHITARVLESAADLFDRLAKVSGGDFRRAAALLRVRAREASDET